MQGKIALEEHFAVPETLVNPRGTYADVTWNELKGRLAELHGERLRLMDEHGIEMMVVSLNAPAVQAVPDPAEAAALARRAERLSCGRSAQAAGPVPGARRAADAGP